MKQFIRRRFAAKGKPFNDAMVNDIFDEILEKAPFPWKNEVVSQRLISEVNKKIGR